MSQNSSIAPVNDDIAIRAEIVAKIEAEERARLQMRREVEAELRQLNGTSSVMPGVVQGNGANNQQVIVQNLIQQAPTRATLGTLVRALYFVFFGWYVGFLWVAAALVICATIVGLPIGILMLTKTSQAFFLW